MHRILLREVVVDAPQDTFAATRDFWAAALLTNAQEVVEFPEFTALPDAASLSWVGLQNIGSGAARFHLDIETDDVGAEVERLSGLGAVKIADGRTWVVMRDPSGLVFDVVPCESPWFAERSREVSQSFAPRRFCHLLGNYTECRISTLCYHSLSGHHRGTAGKRDRTRHPHEAGKPGGSVTRTAAALSAPNSALALPDRLRAETAQWHLEVEALADIPGRVRTRADYTDLLVRLYDLHIGLETQLSDQIWDRAWLGVGVSIAAHCRAGLLIADLQELGVTPPTGIMQQPFSCFGEAIGCLYVLEGSAIGGRIVAGMVRAAIGPVPTAFLTGPGRGHQWPVVRSALRRFEQQGGDGSAAVAGASSTFAAFARQFAGQQVPQ